MLMPGEEIDAYHNKMPPKTPYIGASSVLEEEKTPRTKRRTYNKKNRENLTPEELEKLERSREASRRYNEKKKARELMN